MHRGLSSPPGGRGVGLPETVYGPDAEAEQVLCIVTLRVKADVGPTNVATPVELEEVSGSTVREHMVTDCLLRWLLQRRLCVAAMNFHLWSCISANSRWR